jgi:hypothetical protein
VDVCEDFIRSIHTLNYLIALLARFKSDFVLVPLADLVSGGVSMERKQENPDKGAKGLEYIVVSSAPRTKNGGDPGAALPCIPRGPCARTYLHWTSDMHSLDDG